MKIIITIITCLIIAAATGYGVKEKNDTPHSSSNLLDRPQALQHGIEWDQVQNSYTSLRRELADNPASSAAISLAHLYILEARVTGEHGHYYNAALSQIEALMKYEELSEALQFQALTTKASILLSLHEFEEALQVAETAVKLNNQSAKIYGVLTDCYVELGQYERAIAAADRMMAIKPDIRSYSRISYLREIYGDIPGAISALQMAIRSGYPGYEETAWAMQTLADLYVQYGEVDQAEAVLAQILEVRPSYPFAVAGLGAVAYKRGQLDEAQDYIQSAIDIIPEIGFYISLAEIHQARGDSSAMRAVVEQCLDMLQEDVDSGHVMNLEYAHIYLDLLQDPDEARRYLLIEYEARPDNIDVNRELAATALAAGDNSSARNYHRAAQLTGSKHPALAQIARAIN